MQNYGSNYLNIYRNSIVIAKCPNCDSLMLSLGTEDVSFDACPECKYLSKGRDHYNHFMGGRVAYWQEIKALVGVNRIADIKDVIDAYVAQGFEVRDQGLFTDSSDPATFTKIGQTTTKTYLEPSDFTNHRIIYNWYACSVKSHVRMVKNNLQRALGPYGIEHTNPALDMLSFMVKDNYDFYMSVKDKLALSSNLVIDEDFYIPF
ncbi:zf-TFIIB domain-containing protein [Vibrio sp. Makdt]|uniref:TFIIB-type zinc ribbon-containing protein n=1 Tax=Vibrio sp. Makdt TaxID=2998828 RepID=UPI0022CDB149|nr:zf-TFIIB domain-containing protein [Vibrio sp. Makdt]MDA0152434.1 zf-TFIIB domain-containing protein [Vibrio sp. Makdt]